MDKKNAALELANIKAKLDQWAHEYYVMDNPTVDDAEYDREMQKLLEIENAFPELVTTDSPSQRVGGTVLDGFEKYMHQEKMLSLANAFNFEDLVQFDKQIKKIIGDKNFNYFVEPKIDGLSISLIYKFGNLEIGATRGNGSIGENVTENVKTIKSIPLVIENKNPYFETRGEVYLSKKQFLKINEMKLLNHEEIFANPRNAAAGTLRQLNTKIAAERKLDAWIYYNMDRVNNATHEDSLIELQKLKFKVNPLGKKINGIEAVYDYIQSLTSQRETLDYEIDGIVIKVNEFELYDEIGYNAKTPKWAIAYKFPAEVVSTTLRSIFPTVGRTGRITYNAELDAVQIAGTTVRAATLHNADFIIQKDIRVGGKVKIKKAGDIIPEVIAPIVDGNYETLKKFHEAKKCPECETLLERSAGEVDQYCINTNCPRKIVRSIEHFVSRDAANVDGVSIKLIEKFFENNFVSSISDLYHLEKYKEQILELDKMGEKLFSNIIEAIKNSKQEHMAKLIFGLGIRHVGKKTAQIICEHFTTIDDLANATVEELIAIEDVGDVVAVSIVDWFENPNNKKLISDLKNHGVQFKNEIKIKNINKNFENKNFVITGVLSKPRNYFKDLIEHLGGKTIESVSSKTDFVLAGESAGSKLAKAEKLKVKIINEEELNKLMEEEND
jgi:DNA ligase (NAD+)